MFNLNRNSFSWLGKGSPSPSSAPVASKAIEFNHDDDEEVALLPTGVKNLIKKSVDFTVRLKFQAGDSSTSEGILGVTTASGDRVSIEIAGTSLRCRVYAGATAVDGSRSVTLSDRDDIHTLIMTWDADYSGGMTTGRTLAWLNDSSMSGSLSGNLSGTTGGYLGSHSNGGDYGSIDTFTGTIWAFEVYNSTITATSALDSLTPTREYKFTEKTSTTAEDDQGSGDEITLQNGAAFVAIPE